MFEGHPGVGDDRRRRDHVLEAVDELIDEASGSPLAEDKLRLQGLLELRARLLARHRANSERDE